MKKQNYTVEILVNGRPVKEYAHCGDVYIEGRVGTVYSIRVRNHSSRRIKAVLTVDGNSVLTDDEDLDSGYIVRGYGTLEVKGFRTSDDTEAEFVFSRKGDSRAQKVKGDARNCGVIGVRIYEEQYNFDYAIALLQSDNRDWYPNSPPVKGYTYTPQQENFVGMVTNDSSSCLRAMACTTTDSCNFDTGTEMGRDVESKVNYVSFDTGRLAAEFEIFYASRKSLQKIGIEFYPKTYATKRPQAFGGYCKRPKR